MNTVYIEIRKTRYFGKVPCSRWFACMNSAAIAIGFFTESTEEFLAIPTENPDRTFEQVRMRTVLENHGSRVSVVRISRDDYLHVQQNLRDLEEALS